MPDIKEILKDFKELTGYNQSDIAEHFSITRQEVSLSMKNYSLLYKTSNAYMLETMVNMKIRLLQARLKQLECLKEQISQYARREEK